MIQFPILIPTVGAILIFLMPRRSGGLFRVLSLILSAGNFLMTITLLGQHLNFSANWAGFGMEFALRMDNFTIFIVPVAGFTFLTCLYSIAFMRGRRRQRQFHSFVLLASAFVCGVMLADNLVLMLFFWEGILGVMFALILNGGTRATPAAVKALIICITADFCLVFGVGLAVWQAGTLNMDLMSLPLDNFWSGLAYLMMMIGAIAKAGSMPFHSWIPDAALEAPLPFMAFLPASLDKLAGIYLLTRLNLDLFQMQPGSGLSLTVMIIGCCTLIFAVMMALVQKDYKKLLSYHAISQVGYMILGIGTALPLGILGGLFHMINHAVYKSCLFFTAGSVQRQAGTTDLEHLSGLGRKMPVTFAGFIVAALAISGVPPLNGFFSKEMVFDAALQINPVFYVIAAVGAFFTAASFLKLGHTVFLGKPKAKTQNIKEAPWPMLAPIVILALTCILFGVYNPLPLQGYIEPILGSALPHSFAGLPDNWLITAISIGVLILAFLNHLYGVRKSGKPLGASDHFHYAPGLKPIYAWAEAGILDPYRFCGVLLEGVAIALSAVDKAIDWVYMKVITGFTMLLATGVSRAHTGRHWLYVLWALGGAAAVLLIFVIGGGG